MKEKICPICRKKFFKPENYSITRWLQRINCSDKCRIEAHTKKFLTICNFCNNKFYIEPSKAKIQRGKYCSKKCYNNSQKGKTPWNKGTKGICKINSGSFKKGIDMTKHSQWKGGKILQRGYVYIRKFNSYIRENRFIAEQLLKRALKPQEVIHHINGIKNDNRPENLYLFPDDSTHKRLGHSKYKKELKSNLINK